VRRQRVDAGAGLNFQTMFYGHEKTILQLAVGETGEDTLKFGDGDKLMWIRFLEMHRNKSLCLLGRHQQPARKAENDVA
jgi:hypothetical protein